MVLLLCLLGILSNSIIIGCGRGNAVNNVREDIKNRKKVIVKYNETKSLKDLQNDECIKLNDDDYFKSVVRTYYDIKCGTLKGFVISGVSESIIDLIKEKLLNILSIVDEEKNKFFSAIVSDVFKEKVKKFHDALYRSEGPKDQLLLCFLLKRIYSILVKVDDLNLDISSNVIAGYLSYGKLIGNCSKNFYCINGENIIPNFDDQTLINSVSDIINYIKSCFFVYSIFIGNKIVDVFPMLSVGDMKITNTIKRCIFDGERSDKDVSDFFKEMERKKNNGSIAYIYRQVLNSTLKSNRALYRLLLSVNVEKSVFEKYVGDIRSSENYYKLKGNDFSEYIKLLDKIKSVSENKMYDSILGVYDTKVDLSGIDDPGYEKLTTIKDIFVKKKEIIDPIKFKRYSSKVIPVEKIRWILFV